MTDYEFASGPEFATENDLRVLYDAASEWLSIEGNGVAIDEPGSRILGRHLGDDLPIANSHPAIEYTVDQAVIEELLPEAAADLHLGGNLSLCYNQAFYAQHNHGAPLMQRRDANVMFDIPKAEDYEIESDAVFVSHNQPAGANESWSVSHVVEPDDLDAAIVRPQVLTATECSALQQIVDRLDEIKAIQDARAAAGPPPVA